MAFHSSKRYKSGRVDTEHLAAGFYDEQEKYLITDSGNSAWSFEALVVKEADEIAQRHHDLEDAIRGNLVTNSEVIKIIECCLSGIMNDGDGAALNEIKKPEKDVAQEVFIAVVSRIVVNTLVNNLIENSLLNLEAIQSKFEVNRENCKLFFETHSVETLPIIEESIGHKNIRKQCTKSEDNYRRLKEFEENMSTHILNSYDVQRMDARGKYIIRKLFEAYNTNPQQLSDSTIEHYLHDVGMIPINELQKKRAESGIGAIRKEFAQFKSLCIPRNPDYQIKLMRAICDYIAGMTDQFAISEYEKLYG